MSSVLDYSLTGKKIRLIHAGHPYTSLKENDIGEIRFVFKNPEFTCIQVDWQNGSSLSLIEGKDHSVRSFLRIRSSLCHMRMFVN